MSEYLVCTTQISDESLLIETLREIYGKDSVEIHKTPQSLYGYQGIHTPQKAHIIVRRQNISSTSNDLGFLRTGPGQPLTAYISEWDVRRGRKTAIFQKYSEKWLTRALLRDPRMRNVRTERIQKDNRVVIRVMAERT